MDVLSVATFNVGGIKRNTYKMQSVLTDVKHTDIVVLQETHYNTALEATIFDNMFSATFHIFHSIQNSGKGSLCLLINRNHLGSKHRPVFEIPGRALGIEYKIRQHTILVIGVYMPANPEQRPAMIKALTEITQGRRTHPNITLCLGDFNCVEENRLDRNSIRTYTEVGSDLLQRLNILLNVEDVFRKQNPTERQYSFFSKVHKTQSRLDRIYTDPAMTACCTRYDFHTVPYSDHRIVKVEFNMDPLFEPRGPSYWKMNATLLQDKDLRNCIESIIKHSSILQQKGETVLKTWEELKIVFKQGMQTKSKKHAAVAQRTRMDIELKLRHVKYALAINPTDRYLNKQLDDLQQLLKQEQHRKIKAILHKSHYKDIAEDRISLTSAKKLQKKSAEHRHFYAIKSEDGTLLYKAKEILIEIREQMLETFRSKGCKQTDKDKFLLEPGSTLQPEDKTQLEVDLSAREIGLAIDQMQKDKTPGSDGLSAEFYQTFKHLLVPILEHLYKECYEIGHLTDNMHYGIISQIYKGKGDKLMRDNWRPLTMLNADYKILAKVLKSRLKIVMETIVHPNQTCAVSGRDIHDGLLALYNTVESIRLGKQQGVLLSIDHKQAFDLIEWEFLFDTLAAFNFGPNFIKWIKTIYTSHKVRSSVQVNGYVSIPFEISRGIRQGCPLSALLYVLVAEKVSNYIRQDTTVQGVHIREVEQKVNAYADDTNFMVRNYKSIDRIFEIYGHYQRASGATLKKTKTKILPLGKAAELCVPVHLQQYIQDTIEIYGVKINQTVGFDHDDNWKNTVDALELTEYKQPMREISYYGKINAVMTYTLSKMWYQAYIISPPAVLIKQIEETLDRYLWHPKNRNLVKKDLLKLPRDEGGLNYPDILDKVKAMRIHLLNRRMREPVQTWHTSFDYYRAVTIQLNRAELKAAPIPQIYKEIAEAIRTLGYENNQDLFEICNETLNIAAKIKHIYKPINLYKHRRERLKIETKWKEILNTNSLNFNWQLSKVPYVDGYTRNIHFLVIHNRLQTLDRMSKFVADLKENCEVCNVKEDNIHAILRCARARSAWAKLKPILESLMGEPLTKKIKIFGFEKKSKTEKNWVINVLVQVMQRSIWVTRNYFSRHKKELNIWPYFRNKVNLILTKTYHCKGETILKKWKKFKRKLPFQVQNGRILLNV